MKNIKIVKSEKMYSGFNKITKYFFEFLSFDKKTVIRMDKEIFERKDAVAVLLYDINRDSIVMIEQFRPGSFVSSGIAFPLEIPAGLVDNVADDLEAVAAMETKEETNCVIEKILNIGYFFPEISFGSRKIHLFCAKVDTTNIGVVGGVKEENEDTKISLIKVEDLRKLLDAGEIINSHSLIAIQWFFLNLDKIRKDFS